MQRPSKFIQQFDYEEVSSTMDEASKKVDEGISDGLVVSARKQTLGRGRNGKSFSSEKDLGLWVTLGVLVPKGTAPFQQIKIFSVALCALLNQDYGINAKIKWPNDIFCENKKLCGLLAEWHKNQKTLLLGFGLNVNHHETDWGIDLKEIAISMFQASKKTISLDKLLNDILLAFEEAQKQDAATINELYKSYGLIWGHFALLNGKKVFVKEIANDGALVVGEDRNFEMVYAGDLLPLKS